MSMDNKRNRIISGFIIGTFVTLYVMVSLISTIHVIEFFKLSNPTWLAISLAIAFEIGAAASLASIIALKKMKKGLVWTLFIVLTAMQAMGNTYYAFMHLEDFAGWVELFDLMDEEVIYQKRILSLISGAILPLVALGFIKSLVDYIKPDGEDIDTIDNIDDMLEDIKHDEDKYIDTDISVSVETEEKVDAPIEVEVDVPVEKEKETKPTVVDGGSSTTKVSQISKMLSPEHYTVIPNVNSNKKGSEKRYPENLK